MTTKRPRANVTFAPDLFAVLTDASAASGLSISHIVDQLVGAHMQELILFTAWLNSQKGDMHIRGAHALEQYGPNDLITEMQHLDPAYKAPEARQIAAGAALFDLEDIADLRAMLAEWKAKK